MVDRLMLVDCPLDNKAVNTRLGTASSADLTDWLLERNAVMVAQSATITEPARLDAPKADPQAVIVSLKDLNGSGFNPILDSMNTPCLLVHGQNDPAVTSPDKERLESLPLHIHQIVLEESGHFPMLDVNARFNLWWWLNVSDALRGAGCYPAETRVCGMPSRRNKGLRDAIPHHITYLYTTTQSFMVADCATITD